MFRSVVLTGVCLVGGLLLTAPRPATAAGGKEDYPRLRHALHELREARKELKTAAHDFGGHREKALKATNAAIRQVELCLKSRGENFKGLGGDADNYKKYKHHPHIHRAIHELREARGELERAPHDFGGHRADAVRDINHAIRQLEEALKFANNNKNNKK
jgi:hypothetical protein